MFIHKVCQALEKAEIHYAVVGGYAVALHGAVRGTIDIDIALKWSLDNLRNAEKVMDVLGLVSRLPIDAENVFNFKEEYINNRNLKAWNFYNPSNPIELVDIIITYDLKGATTKVVRTSYGEIKILSRKDLIAMKKESGRPQDLEDIKALEEL